MIVVDDAGWDKKIKENKNYRRFHKKSVPIEMTELWEEIFSGTVATEKHAVGVTMDSLDADATENIPLLEDFETNLLEDDGLLRTSTFNELLHMSLNENERIDVQVLNNVHDALTQGDESQRRTMSAFQVRKNATPEEGGPVPKQRKKSAASENERETMDSLKEGKLILYASANFTALYNAIFFVFYYSKRKH